MPSSKKVYIQTKDLEKSFKVRDGEVNVLKKINLTIREGEFVIIFGPSGCGKSTLLHTLLGLEIPSGGEVTVDGKQYYDMNEDERAIYRRYHYGIIYQQPLWISALTVKENVSFILHLINYDEEAMETKVQEILSMVGMENWADYHPAELSSGQQQTISLARAMTLDPLLLVADEPTGNLDTVSGQELIETFKRISEEGRTIIMVTHDLEYLKYGTHLVHMVDGEIVEEIFNEDVKKLGKIKGKRGELGGVTSANVRDKKFLSNIAQ